MTSQAAAALHNSSPVDLSVSIARYVDARMSLSVQELHDAHGVFIAPARLVGIDLLDRDALVECRDGGARFVCVADGDPYELLADVAPHCMLQFDAVVLHVAGRSHHLDAPDEPARPVFVTTAWALEADAGCVVRWRDNGETLEPGPATGAIAAAIAELCDALRAG